MRRLPLAVGATLLLLAGAATSALGSPAAPPGPGCAASRAALWHYSNGRPAPQPAHSTLPCGVTTGYGGAESHVVALRGGGVLLTPAVVPAGLLGTGTAPVGVGTNQSNASPGALAVTRDQGGHWALLKPAGTTWNPTDHGEYVDPVTGRIFFEDYGPIPEYPAFGPEQEGPAHITVSADGGATWTHTAIDTVFIPENPRFTAGRPPAGQPRPSAYPRVTYFCANSNVGFTSPVIAERLCFKSLDGGKSFAQTSVLLNGTTPVHPECGSSPETYSAIDGYYPESASDGSLYVMVACGQSTYLARSTDEAASFPVVHRPGGGAVTLPVLSGSAPELRIDSRDRMYLVTTTGSQVSLRVSSDLGRSWSRLLNITAPGVHAILKSAVALDSSGRLAVAYLGQRAGQTTWDGYLTFAPAAAAVLGGREPVFVSAIVNDPRRPLLYSSSVQGAGYLVLPGGVAAPYPPPFDNHMFGNDFIGATIAADGSPWGSFTQDCGPSSTTGDCPKQNDETRGFAGRLQLR